jgi:hypothetical protein
MQGIAVGIAIDGDRGYSRLGTGPYDTNGNFTAIRNQQFLDHIGSCQLPYLK